MPCPRRPRRGSAGLAFDVFRDWLLTGAVQVHDLPLGEREGVPGSRIVAAPPSVAASHRGYRSRRRHECAPASGPAPGPRAER